MKTNNLLSAKAALLTIFLLLGICSVSTASSFSASFNGNWSNASTWGGNNPGFDLLTGNSVVIPAGVTVTLDSDLTINGTISLAGGTLDLSGRNLNINGSISASGTGAIIGNNSSSIAFNGYGGAGTLVFASGSEVINNLTINIHTNSGVFLGSALTVNGLLTLESGSLAIGDNDLVVAGKGIIQGGSSSSYVMIAGTGSLVILLPNSGITCMFPVGTQSNYAPVAVTNNLGEAAAFSVSAYDGVLSGGSTGNNICLDQNMVNTSWNVTSSTSATANFDVEMFWNTNMQLNSFNNTQAYVSQYTVKGWDTQACGTAKVNSDGSFSLKLAGVTAYSQFAVFGQSATTAINNVTANTGMSLYPNPASSSINISLAQTANYPLLKVFDVQGKEVIIQQIENSLTVLNINELQRGTYFASLNGQAAQKFIKE